MPIYEYRCTSCGFQKEFLQKITDPVMTVCPRCEKAALSKLVTAAGFQLKGSGWYATDFRNAGARPEAKTDAKVEGSDKSKGTDAAKPESKSESKSESKPEAKPEASNSGAGVTPPAS